jgi:iron complex transport system substrate-binding protein
VIGAKPDLILMTTRSFGAIKGVDQLWKVPGLRLTPAGKNKNALVMDDLKLLGFGPRTGEAIQELRRAFFPIKKESPNE